MIEVYYFDFVLANWEYTLIAIAIMIITIFFNTWWAPVLPALETASLACHVCWFFLTINPSWVMCPKNSARKVFTNVTENGGWNNVGTACCVSTVSVLYCNLVSASLLWIC